MANRLKRTDRSTGNYATYDELTTAVMKLHKHKKHSRREIGKEVGVSGGTATRIINENTPSESQVDLNAMFNKLWRITE